METLNVEILNLSVNHHSTTTVPDRDDTIIRQEDPEDRHLRNSSFGGHVSIPLAQTPLGFDWECLAASRGTTGGLNGRPLI